MVTEVSEEAGEGKFHTVDVGLSVRTEEGPYFDQLKKRYMQTAISLWARVSIFSNLEREY